MEVRAFLPTLVYRSYQYKLCVHRQNEGIVQSVRLSQKHPMFRSKHPFGSWLAIVARYNLIPTTRHIYSKTSQFHFHFAEILTASGKHQNPTVSHPPSCASFNLHNAQMGQRKCIFSPSRRPCASINQNRTLRLMLHIRHYQVCDER